MWKPFVAVGITLGILLLAKQVRARAAAAAAAQIAAQQAATAGIALPTTAVSP